MTARLQQRRIERKRATASSSVKAVIVCHTSIKCKPCGMLDLLSSVPLSLSTGLIKHSPDPTFYSGQLDQRSNLDPAVCQVSSTEISDLHFQTET